MPKGLREILRDGETVICGEGYLWELEKRGYLRSGPFTPEVVLDSPEQVTSLHEEFVHAGSDVVEAFMYFAHRQKMKAIGREDDLETINMAALKLARQVADRTGTLMAANLSKTTLYDPDNPSLNDSIKKMFKEQVEWAVKGGADYIIAETFLDLGEAELALDAIQQHGRGLPAVITLAAFVPDVTADDVTFPEALRQLEELGADVVGLNCGRGPNTMLPLLKEARKVCKGPLAALPVPFRTSDKEKSFQSLTDPVTGKGAYPLNASSRLCSREDIRHFTLEARQIGVQYLGLCCGNQGALLREMAMASGKKSPSCKYAPDVRQSIAVGGDNMTPRQRKVQLHLMGRRYDE